MDSDDTSGSSVNPREIFASIMFSESRHPLLASDEECEIVKNQISSDLRIGSSLHIGEHFGLEKKLDGEFSRPHCCRGFYSPLSIISAKECGAFEKSSRCYRLAEFLTPIHLLNSNRGRRPCWPQTSSYEKYLQGSLWSISRLGLCGVYQHHMGPVNAVNFNESGHLIASSSDDKRVAIADTYTGDLKTRFRTEHSQNVFQVKFVPHTNDMSLITSSRDGSVRLAELKPDGSLAEPPRVLVVHNDACHKIASLPESPDLFLTAGEDGCVFLVDVRKKSSNKILDLPMSHFYTVSVNPSRPNEFCVAGRGESIVRVFDGRKLRQGSAVKPAHLYSFLPSHLRGTSNGNTGGATRADSTTDETGRPGGGDSDDGSSSTDSTTERDTEDLVDEGLLLTSSRLGRQIMEIYSEGLRRRRNTAVRDPLGDLISTQYSVTSAVYSANGDAILASFNDEDIYLFDSQNDKIEPLHVYRGHRNNESVKGVNFFGPNSEYVVSGSDDGFIYIWDRDSEGIVQWLCGDINGIVNVLEPHPVFPILATSGIDNNVKIWAPVSRVNNWRQPETWLRPMAAVQDSSLSSGGRRAALAYDPERVVESMRTLRASNLARHLFGAEVSELSEPSESDFDYDDEDGGRPTPSRPEDEADSSQAESTRGRRKRKSGGNPDASTPNSPASSSSSKRSRHSGDDVSAATVGNVAPQKCLPFNKKDLQLRVAANWTRRARDGTATTFEFRLQDILRTPMNEPPTFLTFLRRTTSRGVLPEDSSTDDDDEDEDMVDDNPSERLPDVTDGAGVLNESSDRSAFFSSTSSSSSSSSSSSVSSSSSSSSLPRTGVDERPSPHAGG